jgi:tetratricopeptide (TPR) repeat protein
MSLGAASRAGLTPKSPGVLAGGVVGGVGRRRIETWVGSVDSFAIGDETIKNTHMQFARVELSQADMLLGADFFLSHRVYVATEQHKIYFTYSGGPVFTLEPRTGVVADASPAASAETAAPSPGDDAPTTADGFARRGAAFMARRDFPRAIADFNRAVELEPAVAKHFTDRAAARLANREPILAMADLGEALKLKPDDVASLLTRGRLYLVTHDEPRARADFDAALRLSPADSSSRILVASAYEGAERYEAAIGHLDQWIAEHPKHEMMAQALNNRCWARAAWGQQLDKALEDCNASLKLAPRMAAILDSRDLVLVRLGRIDEAIADYDAALKAQPKQAWSLYARGLAKQRKGLDADMAAATAIDANVAARAKQLGLAPAAPIAKPAT